jgi:hypothetical protein
MLHKAEEAVSSRPYIGELRRRLLLWHGVARLRVTARRGGTAAGGWKGSRISRRGTWAGGTFGALSGGSPGTTLAGRCWSWWTGAGSLTSRDTSNCTSGTRRWVGVLAQAQDPGRPRAVSWAAATRRSSRTLPWCSEDCIYLATLGRCSMRVPAEEPCGRSRPPTTTWVELRRLSQISCIRRRLRFGMRGNTLGSGRAVRESECGTRS